jgi:hypothetical protein
MPNSAQLFRVLRLRAFGADRGNAMPFGLANKANGCGSAVFAAPISALFQGRSLPISRGSPPTSA